MLYRLRKVNQKWRQYSNMLIDENRWRAHRYGIDQGLIDFGVGKVVDYPQLLEEILGLIREDAKALGCTREVNHARRIIKRGTSAHRQIAVYESVLEKGMSPEIATVNVVQWLIRETIKF
jgi:carboxylate-amine ligase